MSPDDVVSAAEKLITHHIEQSKEHRSGFIRWGAAEEAGEGIDQTHERAQQCMEEGDYFTAFELAILCFSHALDAFEYTADSTGDIHYTIEESLALIEQTIDESADIWDKTRYAEGFTLVTAEVMNTDLDESLSWWMFFLRSSITLYSDKAIQEKFKEVLKSLRKLDDSWRGEYINQELMELQFQLISLISMEKEVEKFLKGNIDNPVMRERMIEPTMD